VAVFATAAPHPLIDAARLAERLMVDRLLVLDLCVPRNVDPAVRALPGVRLVDLADLRSTRAGDHDTMTDGVGVAEQIVAEEVDRYLRWLAGRSAVVALRRLRAGVEARTARLVEEAMRGTAEAMRPLVEDRVRREMRQLAHAPTRALLEAAAVGNAALVEALSRAAWDSSQSGLGCGVSATPR